MSAVLEARDLVTGYGGLTVLREVSRPAKATTIVAGPGGTSRNSKRPSRSVVVERPVPSNSTVAPSR